MSGIEKSVPRITDWHHEACRVMTNRDREGRIFLSYPHRNNRFFFLLTVKYHILYWKKTCKRLPDNSEFTTLRHVDVMLTLKWRKGRRCGCSVSIFPTDWYRYVRSNYLTFVKTMEILIWCAKIWVHHSFELINICCGTRSILPNAEPRAALQNLVSVYMSSSYQNNSVYTKLPDWFFHHADR